MSKLYVIEQEEQEFHLEAGNSPVYIKQDNCCSTHRGGPIFQYVWIDNFILAYSQLVQNNVLLTRVVGTSVFIEVFLRIVAFISKAAYGHSQEVVPAILIHSTSCPTSTSVTCWTAAQQMEYHLVNYTQAVKLTPRECRLANNAKPLSRGLRQLNLHCVCEQRVREHLWCHCILHALLYFRTHTRHSQD
jgi:hypothetical protein